MCHHLFKNGLTSLPSEIGNLTSLTELDLSNNKLATVPPELGNLTSLEFLSLSSNELNSVPLELNNLSEEVKQRLKLDGIQIEEHTNYLPILAK